jgi:hypothetical protein
MCTETEEVIREGGRERFNEGQAGVLVCVYICPHLCHLMQNSGVFILHPPPGHILINRRVRLGIEIATHYESKILVKYKVLDFFHERDSLPKLHPRASVIRIQMGIHDTDATRSSRALSRLSLRRASDSLQDKDLSNVIFT